MSRLFLQLEYLLENIILSQGEIITLREVITITLNIYVPVGMLCET
jgi:hypothetical protein